MGDWEYICPLLVGFGLGGGIGILGIITYQFATFPRRKIEEIKEIEAEFGKKFSKNPDSKKLYELYKELAPMNNYSGKVGKEAGRVLNIMEKKLEGRLVPSELVLYLLKKKI